MTAVLARGWDKAYACETEVEGHICLSNKWLEKEHSISEKVQRRGKSVWSTIHGEGLMWRVARDSLDELDEENGQDNVTVNVQRRKGRESKRRQKHNGNLDPSWAEKEQSLLRKDSDFFLNSLLIQCWQVKYITF